MFRKVETLPRTPLVINCSVLFCHYEKNRLFQGKNAEFVASEVLGMFIFFPNFIKLDESNILETEGEGGFEKIAEFSSDHGNMVVTRHGYIFLSAHFTVSSIKKYTVNGSEVGQYTRGFSSLHGKSPSES